MQNKSFVTTSHCAKTVQTQLIYHLFFLGLFSAFVTTETVAQNQMNLPVAEKPIEIIEFHRQILLITEHGIYLSDSKKIQKIFQSESPIQAAAATRTHLCLATKNGLLITNSPTAEKLVFLKQSLPNGIDDFVAVRTDPTSEQIWVATRDNGIYILSDSVPKKILNALFINDLAVLSKSDYWVGTDAGLIHQVAGQTFRYTEEGVAGFEIPDNIVEHLHLFYPQKLVVQMAQPLSVFHLEGEKTAAHGINIGFIGKKGNIIFDLNGLPNGGILATTAAGLTYLPRHILADDHEKEGFHEIFTEADRPEAKLIPVTQLGLNLDKSVIFQKVLVDSRKNIWLANETQLVVVKVKKLLRWMR
jgi:hypothetical protein